MWYALWNQSSGNIIGEFETEAEAHAEVSMMTEASGCDVVASWMLALAMQSEPGNGSQLLTGEGLLDRALQRTVAVAERRSQI